MGIQHRDIPKGQRHGIQQWEPANAAARLALSVVATDIGKVALQLDTLELWWLANNVGPIWKPFASSAAAANTYRWWRIYVLSNQGDAYCALGEVELRGTVGGSDLTTTSTPCYAVSSFGSTPPSKAVDNLSDPPWINNATGFPTWWCCDLGTPTLVAEVAISPQISQLARSPNTFGIQGSNEAISNPAYITTWTNVKDFSGITGWVYPTFKTFAL